MELHAEEHRREALCHWRIDRDRVVTRWYLVIITSALGAAVGARSAGVGALSLVALAIGVGTTWEFGGWLSFRCRRDRREYLDMVWSRSLWMLHLPWLVWPLFVLVGLFVGLLDLWAGQGGPDAYDRAVIAVFAVWIAGCILAFIVWWRARVRTIAASGYRLDRADAVAFLAGMAVLAGAAGVGFLTGVFTAVVLARWLHLSDSVWS